MKKTITVNASDTEIVLVDANGYQIGSIEISTYVDPKNRTHFRFIGAGASYERIENNEYVSIFHQFGCTGATAIQKLTYEDYAAADKAGK